MWVKYFLTWASDTSSLPRVLFPVVSLEGASVRLVCSGSWLVAAAWSCFPLLGWGEYVPEPYGLSCTIAWKRYHVSAKDAFYVLCSFICFTFVPVLLVVVSQCCILLKIYRFSSALSARGIHTSLRRTERRLSLVSYSPPPPVPGELQPPPPVPGELQPPPCPW